MSCLADKKLNIKHIVLVSICVFASMLLCCAFTSPIYPYYNNSDSAIFMLVGRGISEGKLCYVDLFDHKGPILFFIEALGWKIGGRTGIWLIECIAVLISAFAIEGICRELKAKSFVPLVSSAMVLFFTFGHGNLTEDYSLPFIYVSLYFTVKYFTENEEKHSPWYALFYGISFGVIAFIRINNALIICALILCIAIDLISKKQFKNLAANLLAGLAGIAIVAVPVCAYFYLHNALYDMVYATFLYNLLYAEESSHVSIFSAQFPKLVTLYAPIVFSLLVFIKNKSMSKALRLTLITATALSLLMLVYANVYEHYFTLAIPMFTVAVAITVPDADFKKIFKNEKNKKSAFAIALGIIVAVNICMAAYRAAAPFYKGYLTDISYDRYNQMNVSAKVIPDEERNSVLGFGIPSEWYMDCDIVPCYKYYTLQYWWTNANLDVYGDTLNYITSEHPLWLITKTETKSKDESLSAVINEYYELQEENDYACFYRYIGDGT